MLLGAVLVDLIDNSLIRWAAISEFWRDGLLGLLILLAVAADTVVMRQLNRLRRRKSVERESASVPGDTVPKTVGESGGR